MEYITTKEASQKWGISAIRITILANDGRIPGAQRLGKSWLIPATAVKPEKLKPRQSKNKETDNYFFPLYHFRPDWVYIKKEKLSKQQQQLWVAEIAVLECRFYDAFNILESIMKAPEDIFTEIACLWHAGICCIALNKPDDFSNIFLRLQLLFSEDFPHKDDLIIILDVLKTYIDTIYSTADYKICSTAVDEQSIPLTCVQVGYVNLSKEAVNPGSADIPLLELNLRLLKNTSSIICAAMMHCYLIGIYLLRQDIEAAKKHANDLIKITYEHNYYFPLVTFYDYFSSVLSPALDSYPDEFKNHCHNLSSQYKENFFACLSALNEYTINSKLTDEDYPYIYAVLTGVSNSQIANKLGVSRQTVARKMEMLYEKLGVRSKKEMEDFLRKYL